VKRVALIGSGGAGKSTLATAMGEKLGLPVMHLDAAFWQPGWVERERADWLEWQRLAVLEPAWIMDGNYGGTMDVRLNAADTVIFLDLPPTLCVMRALTRAIRYSGRSRPDMAANCPERVDLKFLLWIWNYRRKNRPAILEKLEKLEGTRVMHLQSAAYVRNFLNELG
jgi:adenylate kinase family enzyme